MDTVDEDHSKEQHSGSGKYFTITSGHLREVHRAVDAIVNGTNEEVFSRDELDPISREFSGKKLGGYSGSVDLPYEFLEKLFSTKNKGLRMAQGRILYAMVQESKTAMSTLASSFHIVSRSIEVGRFDKESFAKRVNEAILPNSKLAVGQNEIFASLSPKLVELANSTPANGRFAKAYETLTDPKTGYVSDLAAVELGFMKATSALENAGQPADLLDEVSGDLLEMAHRSQPSI